MRRRKHTALDWQLDAGEPTAVADARIALALLNVARRVPSASGVDCDEVGRVIAPAIAPEPRLWAEAMRAHRAPALPRRDDSLPPTVAAAKDEDVPFDLDAFGILGTALLRATPAFDKLFSHTRRRLADLLAGTVHPSDANVDILAARLHLSAAETSFLRLATAHAYSSIPRAVFRFVDTPVRLLKAGEAITGAKGGEVSGLFRRQGRLAASGLLDAVCEENGGRDLEDRLRLSPLGDRLLGVPVGAAEQMAERVLCRLPAPPVPALAWPHLADEARLLAAALRAALAERRRGINILLHGAPGTGKTQFARQLVGELGAQGFVVSHLDEEGGEATRRERLEALRLAQTFAGEPGGAVLVLDEAEDIFVGDHHHPLARLFARSGQSKAWMNELLECNDHPVIWISNAIAHLDPAYLRRFIFCLEFPISPLPIRREVAALELAPLGCSETFIDAVARQHELAPATLAGAAQFARLCADSGTPPELAVRTVLVQQAKASGRTLALNERAPVTRFDLRYLNVAGVSEPQQVVDALSDGAPAALLFSGPPGTGKTAFASALASGLGRRLVVRTASDVNGMYYGESERNVAQMFRSCDPATDLLFIDEADVLLGARDAAHQRVDRAVTAEFLRWMETFCGVFACATNHAGEFDSALMRRFTFRMEFRSLAWAQCQDLFAEQAMGWTGVGTERPPLPSGVAEALHRLPALTAGDFANVARRMRLLRVSGPDRWLLELAAEHAHKKAVPRPIGFR